MTPPERHLGDALSAFLDDELAPAARREAQLHLDGCGTCRDELQLTTAARASVRALPVHHLPPARWGELLEADGLSGLARPARRRLWAAAAVAAAVAALMLPNEHRVAPALPALVDSHAARASVTGEPVSQLAPIAVPVGFGP